jgi:hypothetical protein
LQKDRELAFRFRPVDIGAEHNSVPHLRGSASFQNDLVRVGCSNQTGGENQNDGSHP